MRWLRLFLVACGLLVVGAALGFLLWMRYAERPGEEAPGGRADGGGEAPGEPVVSDPPRIEPGEGGRLAIRYPDAAIEGELTLHFRSRKDYRAYLKALGEVDAAPLGQIDELMAVRVDSETLARVRPGRYGGRPSFSYRVEQPPPPVEIAPERLATLRPYGRTARAITDARNDGDGTGVMVGILDSGIRAHPQFDDVYIVHIDLVGGGVDGPGSAHGTSVASIIAGTEGIAPNAELFVVRVLDDSGTGNSFHVAEGIVQAVDLGVKVLNLSLGVYTDSQLVREAVRYADQRGVLMVASAGNDGYGRLPFPAAYEEVLSVTAVDAGGRHALFPNQSERIDFAAPGVGIVTAKEAEGTAPFSGTSAAAPFVSATLARLLSGEEERTPRAAVKVLRRLLNDAGPPGRDSLYGGGLLDWKRLRERSEPGVRDVALAGIHLDGDVKPGTTAPVQVTVQNRGTTWCSRASLEVALGDDEPVTFTIGALGPGQITTRKVFAQIPPADSEDPLSVSARVFPEDPLDEVRLENNLKSVLFRPAAGG